MRIFANICLFIFGLVISLIIGFYFVPLLLKFNFPNIDLGGNWITLIKWLVFVIGGVSTLRGMVSLRRYEPEAE